MSDIKSDTTFNFKIPLISQDELRMAKQRGQDVSYETADGFVEAYLYNGNIYVAGTDPLGPRE